MPSAREAGEGDLVLSNDEGPPPHSSSRPPYLHHGRMFAGRRARDSGCRRTSTRELHRGRHPQPDGKRHRNRDPPAPGLVGADREHARIHRLLHGLDDVRRHRHSDQEDPGSQRDGIRAADGNAGADRLADPRSAGHLDRSLRRQDRDGDPDGNHRARDLADGLRDPVLAFHRHRTLRRACRGIVLGGHALRRALVPAQPPGDGHGRLRRRQLGGRCEQADRAEPGRRLRLDDGAAGLCGGHAGHGHPVLVADLQ